MALRTFVVRRANGTAVVASEVFLSQMVRHRHAAILARFHVAAVGTPDKRREPPAVLQENDPFSPRKPVRNLFPEYGRDWGLREVFQLATTLWRKRRPDRREHERSLSGCV